MRRTSASPRGRCLGVDNRRRSISGRTPRKAARRSGVDSTAPSVEEHRSGEREVLERCRCTARCLCAAVRGAGVCRRLRRSRRAPRRRRRWTCWSPTSCRRTCRSTRSGSAPSTGFINAEIRPQVQGYLLTKNYNEGDVVQPGQLLFQIDPREFQAQLDQARGDLAQAQAALGKTPARRRPLHAARQGRRGQPAGARQRRAAEPGQPGGGRLRPRRGRAGQAQPRLDEGDLADRRRRPASPSRRSATWSSPTTLADHGVAARSDQGRLPGQRAGVPALRARAGGRASASGDRARARSSCILADGTVFPQRGTVSVIGREVDPRTGTLTIEALFPNPDNVLRPGGYAKVRAVIDDLPERAGRPAARRAGLPGQRPGRRGDGPDNRSRSAP